VDALRKVKKAAEQCSLATVLNDLTLYQLGSWHRFKGV
jgi:hypothetical protein